MPELPEVETVLRGVAPRVVGRAVVRVIVREPRLRAPVPASLKKDAKGKRFLSAARRGKWMIFHWSGGGVLVHLGMSGALRITTRPPREKHEHLGFELDDGAHLIFRDPRRFGRVESFCGDADSHPLLARLGPEPLSRAFNGAILAAGLRGRDIAVKSALMDGKIVAGIGNIYAGEALFSGGVHPQTPSGALDARQCDKLAREIKGVLRRAIRAGGSTIRDFVNGDGEPGWFQMQWKVYGRENLPCRKCGAPIRRIVAAQRSSFFCPRCQPRGGGGK